MTLYNCDLHIVGIVTTQQMLSLGKMLMRVDAGLSTEDEYLEWLHEGELSIDFIDRMDDHEPDPELWEFLETFGCYASWRWSFEETQAAGVDIWDPFKKKTARLWFSQGRDPMMPIDKTVDESLIAHYQHYAHVYKMMQHTPFQVANSAHDAMEKLKILSPETQNFLSGKA